ncbi:Poly [ADP-ribose] polymerase 6 [Merluccius polli]|uniref:Poly [ADP-ribose] polymerase n=1 Tax=Merluccius polli TaxID=89951 RepID=A0AA47P0U7_MERPO|nr:Poly [ADP-ribose] polymerase 6 [Merluccius polli]
MFIPALIIFLAISTDREAGPFFHFINAAINKVKSYLIGGGIAPIVQMMPVLRDTAGSESMSRRHMCSRCVSAIAARSCWVFMMDAPASLAMTEYLVVGTHRKTRPSHIRPKDVACQPWTDSQSDEDSDSEEFLYGSQGSCAADLYRHPQLEADIEAVRALYSDTGITIREYGTIDGMDIDMHINVNFLNETVAKAWKINQSEPVTVRLHFSLSRYLDGPAPSVEVFQESSRGSFSPGIQLQKFISQEWKDLTNEGIRVHQKACRQRWFKPGGTIKKFRARLNILSPISRSNGAHEHHAKGRAVAPDLKVNRLMSRTNSCTFKNPKGELFTYTANGKRVVLSSVKSPAQLSTKQFMELLFSSQAARHCKVVPSLQHGFLVQLMKYAEQRIPTLNEYCVVCDEQHVFQNGPMLKPAVCTRELCVFSYHTLGVMSGATEEVATGAEVVDLLVAMCRAALQSSRKSVILEPYPSVIDPCNPKTLAFTPRRKSYDRLERALDCVMLIRKMTQGPYLEMKKQMDRIDPLAHPLLQWIIASNRSHIVKLLPNRQLEFMHTPHQFLLISSPPSKEARFHAAKKIHGSAFAFHGSHIENWHSILRSGLVNASYTKLQLNGAAYGKGIYLSPISSISFGYSEMGKGQHQIPTKAELIKDYSRINKMQQESPGQTRFLQRENLTCIALCEVITSKDLQKHGNIWVCPISDHVCTRFFFVYENGQVGDANINTQDASIQREIIRVIATKPC